MTTLRTFTTGSGTEGKLHSLPALSPNDIVQLALCRHVIEPRELNATALITSGLQLQVRMARRLQDGFQP